MHSSRIIILPQAAVIFSCREEGVQLRLDVVMWTLQQVIVCFLLTGWMREAVARPQTSGANLISAPAPQQTIHKILKLLECCGLEEQKSLHRVYLNSNATCNDGTPAGFYLRKSHGSKRWIIYLEGGWYCYDQRSCHTRWLRMRHLMSSKQWPETRNVGGILSPNPEENPYWWNANHVFVPYCTSDAWSGQRIIPTANSRFSFMGAVIVQHVVRDLLALGLNNASSLLLVGSSAGGIGVMLNLEPVKEMLKSFQHILVRGVSDSGWFLDRPPYSKDVDSLAPVDAVKRGHILWEGQVPASCKSHFPQEPWRCYFGYRLYSTLRVPLFIFQWLFDEAQMTADNVGTPVTKQQWDYIHKMGDSLRHTFHNVTSVFAPSCISHSVLTKRDWQLLRIDDVTLPQALRCWELRVEYAASASLTRDNTTLSMLADAPLLAAGKSARKLTKSGSQSQQVNTQPVQRKRRRRKNRNKNRGRKRKERKGNRMRPQRSASAQEPVCQHRLIERCSWPQCNHSCPKLHNPFTGEEMDFIELLKSFGLDMMSVANALGIDINTLNNMDHEELLNLLTQQAN